MDDRFKKAFADIYSPEVGYIYQVENYNWDNEFASNKPGKDIHPAVIAFSKPDIKICKLIPGTSKRQIDSCVYRVNIQNHSSDDILSYFLIKLWMNFPNTTIINFNRGWNGVDELSEGQVIDLKQQIKFCKG